MRRVLTTIGGEPATRLGLAACPDQQPACVRAAYRGGINYFFFYSPSYQAFIQGLKPLLRQAREHLLVATGSRARSRQGLERVRRALCTQLGVETLDVFFAEYVSPADDDAAIFAPGGVLDILGEWRAAGLIRYAGATTHDRALARRLVESGRVDVLMQRFNMAHRKAEDAVFPAARRANIPVVAFTATRWRTLLAGHPEWATPPPSAADCYRYCLAQPAVRTVLSAPSTPAQTRENLEVLGAGRLGRRQIRAWNAYGDLVHGDGRGRFETRWP